ncbi:MAG TPA: ATP-binding protein, partial [Planctomycetota bacterium]|nr:ATP-binding protein [Planctomycetota bacterium]
MGTSLSGRMDRATAAFEAASAGAVRALRRVQLGLFVAAALVALAAFEGVRRGLARLPSLEEGFQALARGDLGARVEAGPGADEVAHLAGAFNEMSRELERARAEVLARDAELARGNEALRRADEHKSQFLANMSHELRTPLTSIIGFADLLRREAYGPLTPKQAERVDAVLKNARGLLALVADILDLAKIEAGKLSVSPAPAAPGELAADVADVLRPLAAAKGLALEVEVAPDLPAVVTDAARARQILTNLGGNAVKFTAAGRVAIAVARAGRDEDAVRIEVLDTGPGIAPADLARLFRRFEQLEGSATRRHGGTGLGLHISRRLADLIGAAIEVESEPGRGSRFALVLPRTWKGEAKEDEACRPTVSAAGSSSSTTTPTS